MSKSSVWFSCFPNAFPLIIQAFWLSISFFLATLFVSFLIRFLFLVGSCSRASLFPHPDFLAGFQSVFTLDHPRYSYLWLYYPSSLPYHFSFIVPRNNPIPLFSFIAFICLVPTSWECYKLVLFQMNSTTRDQAADWFLLQYGKIVCVSCFCLPQYLISNTRVPLFSCFVSSLDVISNYLSLLALACFALHMSICVFVWLLQPAMPLAC